MDAGVIGPPSWEWLSRTFGGAQGQRGAATSWSAAPLSIFRAAPIANWQQEAGLPKTAFACNGITALGLIPFHQKCGRATAKGSQLVPVAGVTPMWDKAWPLERGISQAAAPSFGLGRAKSAQQCRLPGWATLRSSSCRGRKGGQSVKYQ